MKFFTKSPVAAPAVKVEGPAYRYFIARQESISGRMVNATDEFGTFDTAEEAYAVAQEDRKNGVYRGLTVGREHADGREFAFAGYAMGNAEVGLRFPS